MPSLALLWIWICAVLNCAGWGLSALHLLNAQSYAVIFLLGLLLLARWRPLFFPTGWLSFGWSRCRRRFRRPLPLAFFVLTSLILLGGALYAPSNYDAMTYREPRILHWLAAGQWHWIHTIYPRVNARACGVEWVSAPLMVFTQSDRLLFLINMVSFLLLPGLVYSVFTRLGVRRKVAWHWMWIVPTGHCFVLQAGGSGNDLFGAPFVLAGIDFALRARASGRSRDFFASILAAALMTSAKTSDLPLMLVWGVAILPSWRRLFDRPARLALVCLIAVACSFLPTALLNQYYCADWTGWKSEGTCVKSDPPLRLASNCALVAVQNLAPPIFPLARQWNAFVTNHIPPALSVRLHQTVVEPGAAELNLPDMQIEESAGLGPGIWLLVLVGLVAGAGHRGRWFDRERWTTPLARWQSALRWLPWVSLMALLSQSEVAPISRILAPYYALLLPAFLTGPGQVWVVTRRWWSGMVLAVFLLAAVLLAVTPARPLFPAITILSQLHARKPDLALLARANTIYTLYRERSTAFAPAVAQLPPGLKILGLFTYDDPEVSLWKPFGSRRILHVRPEDTRDYLQRQGIEYVLLGTAKMPDWFHVTPAEWVSGMQATVVKKIPLTLRAAEGPVEWWLVKLPGTNADHP